MDSLCYRFDDFIHRIAKKRSARCAANVPMNQFDLEGKGLICRTESIQVVNLINFNPRRRSVRLLSENCKKIPLKSRIYC